MNRLFKEDVGNVDEWQSTQDYLDYINQLIPMVMVQMNSDSQALKSCDHPRMVVIANESKELLEILKELKTKYEGKIRNQTYSISKASVMSTSSEDNHLTDILVYASSNTEIEITPVEQQTFTIYGHCGDYQGLFNQNTSQCFVFDKVIAKTRFGTATQVVSGTMFSGQVHVENGSSGVIKVYKKSVMNSGVNDRQQSVRENPMVEFQILRYLWSVESSHYADPKKIILELLNVYQDDCAIYALFPLAGSQLYDVVDISTTFSISRIKTLFRNMVNAVNFCHEHGVVHHDISPDNFLVSQPNGDWTDIRLGDFGFAMLVNKEADGSLLVEHTGFRGKWHYAAPELHQKMNGQGIRFYDGRKVDLWSTVVSCYFILFRRHRWGCAIESDMFFKHYIVGDRMSSMFPSEFPCDLVNFFCKSLKYEPSARLNGNEMLNGPWFSGVTI